VRFLLDNDVDVAVGRVLRSAGHECWTAVEANLAGRVAENLDELVNALTQHPDVVVIVSTDDTEARPPSWK
jgi:hypothetical protein